jgi:hypothetical protein
MFGRSIRRDAATLLIPNRRSTQATIRSRTISPEIPADADLPGHDLAIAGTDSEQHTQDLAITAGGLEVIGAPGDVRAQCNHPHKALGYRSPRMFIVAMKDADRVRSFGVTTRTST